MEHRKAGGRGITERTLQLARCLLVRVAESRIHVHLQAIRKQTSQQRTLLTVLLLFKAVGKEVGGGDTQGLWLIGLWGLFLTDSLSRPRICFIPPSAQAGMNRSLQTCVPLVSKEDRQGEEWSKTI